MAGDVWIEGIGVHLAPAYITTEDLAHAHGVDPAKYEHGIGQRKVGVPVPGEDPVTMAVEAGARCLEAWDVDPRDIGLVVVGTECGIDLSKPVAVEVHRFLRLPSAATTYDMKHGCFAPTAALTHAGLWVRSPLARGRKALVVASDVARYALDSPGEVTQGAGAVALVAGTSPGVVRLDLDDHGEWTRSERDFWHPNHILDCLVDGPTSVAVYLEALAGAYGDLRTRRGGSWRDYTMMLYHAPFAKMVLKAHRRLLAWELGLDDDRHPEVTALVDEHRRALIDPWLWAVSETGNLYGASLLMGLTAGLTRRPGPVGGKLSLFSFGSGASATFTDAEIGPRADEVASRVGLEELLAARVPISLETYRSYRDWYETLDTSMEQPASRQEILSARPEGCRDPDVLYEGRRGSYRVYS